MATGVRKCRLCKEYFKVGTMVIINNGAYCSMESAVKYSIESAPKQQKKIDKAKKIENNREKRERRRDSKPHQLELTRISCNRFIRELDKGKQCISCGRRKCGARMEAGHYKSVASHPELRFDPRNIYLQGAGCNQATSNRSKNTMTVAKDYESRLRGVMGNAMVNWLNGPHKAKHYSCDDLRAMRKVFDAEHRLLVAGNPPSRDWRKLDE